MAQEQASELELEDLKRIEFEMLCAFDDFAKKHGLCYWLIYGTLLGAARHKGYVTSLSQEQISALVRMQLAVKIAYPTDPSRNFSTEGLRLSKMSSYP